MKAVLPILALLLGAGFCVPAYAVVDAATEAKVESMASQPPSQFLRLAMIDAKGPLPESLRADLFVIFAIQSLDTYTPTVVERNHTEFLPFMGETLRADASAFLTRKIRDVKTDGRTSMFIPDHDTPRFGSAMQASGKALRKSVVTGKLYSIIKAQVVTEIPMDIELTLQEAPITAANPYGFILTAYHEKPLAPAPAVAPRP